MFEYSFYSQHLLFLFHNKYNSSSKSKSNSLYRVMVTSKAHYMFRSSYVNVDMVLLLLALLLTTVRAGDVNHTTRRFSQRKGPCWSGSAQCYNYFGAMYINRIREAAGEPRVKLGSTDMLVHALEHSKKMRAKGRMFNENISAINADRVFTCGEFLSAGMVAHVRVSDGNPAEKCVRVWRSSRAHKNVINFKHHKDISLGIVVDHTGDTWCTLLFAVNTYPQCVRPSYSPSASPSVSPSISMTPTSSVTPSVTPSISASQSIKQTPLDTPLPSKKMMSSSKPQSTPNHSSNQRFVYQFSISKVVLKYSDGTANTVKLICFIGSCQYCTETVELLCHSPEFSMLVDSYIKHRISYQSANMD